MSDRIGPIMADVVTFVAQHPGVSKIEVCRGLGRKVGRNANNGYAYGPVNRCVERGLIVNRSKTSQKYALEVA